MGRWVYIAEAPTADSTRTDTAPLTQLNVTDISQLTVENALFKSFDTIVRLQLEPVWHTVGRRSKAIVSVSRERFRTSSHLTADTQKAEGFEPPVI